MSFFFSSRRRHTRSTRDWSSDVCSSDLQDVRVTMLAEPHSVIHATTGYLPRKQIGMRRGWVAPGLAALAPLFRFGPVLVDPKLIRMPVASDIRGTRSWSHRSDVSTWAD